MSPRELVNRTIRLTMLGCMVICFIVFLAGIVVNITGSLDFRPGDDVLKDRLGRGASIDTIHVDGMSVAFVRIYDTLAASEAAVFFVHGSPGSLDAYSRYLKDPHLRAHAGLYAYDRLGYGGSLPSVAEGSLKRQSNQLEALVRHAGARCNLLVGHSLGCTIAAYAAMKTPGLIDGMILVAAPLDPALEPSSWWRHILGFPIIRLGVPKSFRISNRELIPLKRELELCKQEWVRLRGPVIFIHGEQDKLVPVENVRFGREMMANAEISEIILEGKGHFILWTEQHLITDAIIRMLEHCN